jgi:hypothetical protein
MSASEILTEYKKCDSPSLEVLGALLREAVDFGAICRRLENGTLADPPREAQVVYTSDNGFEFFAYRPEMAATAALIFMVRDQIGDAIDLAAWNLGRRRPALWCGRGSMLGSENLFGPRMTEGLLVHPSPLEWLRAACNGVVNLALEASRQPRAEILELLARHKAAIIGLLRAGRDGWSAADWQTYFDERAGIAEFDGGLPRSDAEARAFDCCVVEWLNRNTVCSPPGRCLGCGGGELVDNPLLPFGVEPTGHAWLHSRCWRAWSASREVEAVRALTRMEIVLPTSTQFSRAS